MTRSSRSSPGSKTIAGDQATVVVTVGSDQNTVAPDADHPVAGRQLLAGFLDLPERSAKPRDRGLTHVLDQGLSCADGRRPDRGRRRCVDIVKLGWGTALVTGNLTAKLARYRAHDMPGRPRRHADRDRAARRPPRRAGRLAAGSWGSTTSRSPTARSRWSRERKREIIARLARELHRLLRGRLQGRRARSWPRTAGSRRSRPSSRPARGRSSPRRASPGPPASSGPTARSAWA